MMIALAILGMGLLVIAAALPVGIRYTRDSINMATGEAAAEYALDLIEQSVSLPQRIFRDNIVTNGQVREPGLFEPRDPNSGLPMRVLVGAPEDYEPVIKVRALYTQNVIRTPATLGYQLNPLQGWAGEEALRGWLLSFGLTAPTEEFDINKWLRPALSSAAMVYPPITPNSIASFPPEFTPLYFFNHPYAVRQVRGPDSVILGTETTEIMDRRTVWTGFYRRVSYSGPSGSGQFGDPDLYEFITVVSRLPSGRHRFPVQDTSVVGGGYSGNDTAVPIPWLVWFDPAFGLPSPASFDAYGFPVGTAPATLQFHVQAGWAGLFPVGAIFIPARNDLQPSVGLAAVPLANRVGFCPPAPTTLPIFEVVERPDATTMVVKFNGYYPMKGNAAPGAVLGPFTPILPTESSLWPVWVIPPAFEELSGGFPQFPNRSTIVAVGRRYVRLREIP